MLRLFWRGGAEQAEFLRTLEPVVVMGRGHSGTRVLSWICAHLGVRMGAGEEHFTGDPDDEAFTDRIEVIAARNLGVNSLAAVQAGDLRRFQSAAAAYFRRLTPPTQRWGWKFPETYLVAPYVVKAFPRAKLLHLVRDGRDLAFKTHLTDNPRKKLGRAVLAECGAMDLPRHLQAASSWAYQVDRFDAFRRELADSQVFDVRFEDLCVAPVEWTEKLCGFLGLPMTERCRQYLTSEINPRNVGQYRNESAALVREVEQRTGGTLKRHGYVPQAEG
ncbi:MAG TPA: sulfotransferase [Verrucomicrobiae bacterium]|nr:sulfotransferase [Verrucomicrobiae bacterium]